MANTRRESTALQRSENTSHSSESLQTTALGLGPHLSNSLDSIRQGATPVLPVQAPWISRIGAAVDTALALYSKPGSTGATVSLFDGNMAGRKLYAVSIYPKRTLILKTPPDKRVFFAYALENLARLRKPGHALGIWNNQTKARHELDVVVCCRELAEAIALGRRAGQLCIYNLETGKEIYIDAGGRNA
jgi:hypothetical protein